MANIKSEQVEALEKINELNRKVELFCLCCKVEYKKKKDGSIALTCNGLTKRESNLLTKRIRLFFTASNIKVSFCEDIDPSNCMDDDSYILKAVLTIA